MLAKRLRMRIFLCALVARVYLMCLEMPLERRLRGELFVTLNVRTYMFLLEAWYIDPWPV